MNFERSPFLAPWAPRKVRRVRSVSFDTLRFQRTASSFIWHLCRYADKHLYAHCKPHSGSCRSSSQERSNRAISLVRVAVAPTVASTRTAASALVKSGSDNHAAETNE